MPKRETSGMITTAATTLQMVRAEINLREFHRWMGARRLQDPDHAMHCLLKESFGELAPKPFRFIEPRSRSRGILYGYCTADATDLNDVAAIYADPLQNRIICPHMLDSKPMPSQWKTGRRLGFEIRIRPIVRCGRGSDRPGKERDAFQSEAETHPKGEMKRTREQVYTGWLASQLERIGGAVLEPGRTQLVSFQRTRAIRKQHARYSEGPDALMRGTLTITDPQAFSNLLARGIGRHRAYGYGMLLLRPPQK